MASVAKRLAAGRAYYRDEGDGDNGADDDKGEEVSSDKPPSSRILIMSLLEGSNNRRQRAWAWAEPPHVVIGNPTALVNMVAYGGLRYHTVKFVVLDEVDACLLSEETREELHTLLAKYLSPSFMSAELLAELEEKSKNSVAAGIIKDKGAFNAETLAPWKQSPRQTVFCSATIPQHNHFIKQVIMEMDQNACNTSHHHTGQTTCCSWLTLAVGLLQCIQNQWTLSAPAHVHVSPGELMPTQLRHTYLTCPDNDQKMSALRAYLKREAQTGRLQAGIIFMSRDSLVEDAVSSLADWATSALLPPEEQLSIEEVSLAATCHITA